jgi:patatin-like phospholipase/acyl hydrolase
MRGLASLLIIDAIMKVLPTKNNRALLPCDVFDLICGTSVGGLVSILLGRLGLDCQTAINIYEKAVNELLGEKRDVWKTIADGHFLDTLKFDAFVDHIVEKYTGSPDISMRFPSQDNQDLRSHPSTKVL